MRKINSDAAEAWSWGFQDGGTGLQGGVVELYNSVMYYLIVILIGVIWMLISAVMEKGSPLYKVYVGMAPKGEGRIKEDKSRIVEVVWTVIPGVVLVGIAVPSFKLLYMMDEVMEPSVTVKAVGYQWYWSYAYGDYKPTIRFESYMKGVEDLEEGELRMLEVDNRVVLPVGRRVRVLVTGGDVLHSWAVPSLGVKADAIPGRLNQVSIRMEREGIFYGQCSEICVRLDRDVDLREDQGLLESWIVHPSVLYDVIMRELGKEDKVKTTEGTGVGRWGRSWNLSEAASRDHRGGNIKDKITHKILSSNEKKGKIFRGTGLKNSPINTIHISKLGNLVRFRDELLSYGILAAGGKMETKRNFLGNQNSPAYRGARMFSMEVRRSLEGRIKEEIEKGGWIKEEEREELREYIRGSQGKIKELEKKGEYKEVNEAMESMLCSLNHHVYVIETFGPRLEERKIEMLKELRKWFSSGRNSSGRIERTIQELFKLVWEPVVRERISKGNRKGRAIEGIREKLEREVREKGRSEIREVGVRRREGYVRGMMKEIPIPNKFKEIMRGWLEAGEFGELMREVSMKGLEEEGVIRKGEGRVIGLEGGELERILGRRGLEISEEEKRVIGEGGKYNYGGYTFVYQERSKGRARVYVYPSKEEVKRIKGRLRGYFKENQNKEAYRMIGELNPILRGWVNKFKNTNERRVLGSLRGWIYRRVKIWMKRKHPRVGREWLRRRYIREGEFVGEGREGMRVLWWPDRYTRGKRT